MPRLPSIRTLGTAGMIGPWLWTAIVLVLTVLEYDTLTGFGWTPGGSYGVNYPSSLALGQFGWAQMANFALLGLSLISLAIAVYRSVQPGRLAKVAPVLMGIAGLGFLLSVFPTDTGPPNAPATWHGAIHGIGFIVGVLFAGISLIGVRLRSLLR